MPDPPGKQPELIATLRVDSVISANASCVTNHNR